MLSRRGSGSDRARPPLRPAARGGVAVAELRVPATEVARRAGHGVAVLLKIYAYALVSGVHLG